MTSEQRHDSGQAPVDLEVDRRLDGWRRDGRCGPGVGDHGPAAVRPPPDDPEADGPDADPESVARTILLDQLTGRARSRKELADKLAAKDVPDEVATRLLDRFEEVGLVDDAAFARSWVSQPPAAARDWPAGRWPRSCAARASTTRSPARRSTRSTRTTRRPPPARWSARSCAAWPGSTTRPGPAGWSGCSPARATRPAWPSPWCATSSAGARSRGRPRRCRLGHALKGCAHDGPSTSPSRPRPRAERRGPPGGVLGGGRAAYLRQPSTPSRCRSTCPAR